MKKSRPTVNVCVRLDKDMATWLADQANARRVKKSIIIRDLMLAAMGK